MRQEFIRFDDTLPPGKHFFASQSVKESVMVKRINRGKTPIRIAALPSRTATSRVMRDVRRAVVVLIGGLALCATDADAQLPQSTQPADAVTQPTTRGPTQAELDQSDIDPGLAAKAARYLLRS